jgi:hypothetical protein
VITLLPNYTHSILRETSQPLDSAPDYVRSRNATRWHRARSGNVHQDGRISYSYWCGGGATSGLGADSVPDGDLLCATCEGRWSAQQENRLIFTPIKALPPSKCPASRKALFPQGVRNPFPCLACGASVKVTGGWNRGPSVQVHVTGPNLVNPCPHHGWNRLRLDRQERVVCGCTLQTGVWG